MLFSWGDAYSSYMWKDWTKYQMRLHCEVVPYNDFTFIFFNSCRTSGWGQMSLCKRVNLLHWGFMLTKESLLLIRVCVLSYDYVTRWKQYLRTEDSILVKCHIHRTNLGDSTYDFIKFENRVRSQNKLRVRMSVKWFRSFACIHKFNSFWLVHIRQSKWVPGRQFLWWSLSYSNAILLVKLWH